MNKKEILDCLSVEIYNLLGCEIDNRKMEDNLISIGFTSLIFLKFLIFIEDYFHIEFDTDSLLITSFTCVGDLVNYIYDKLGDSVV